MHIKFLIFCFINLVDELIGHREEILEPWNLRRGVKQQWLHVTVWHGEEERPAHLPPPPPPPPPPSEVTEISQEEILELTFRALALRQSESNNCRLLVVYIVSSGAKLFVEAW